MELVDVTTIFTVFDVLRDVNNAIAKAHQNWKLCRRQKANYVHQGDFVTAGLLGDIMESILACIDDYFVYKRRLESSQEYLRGQ